MIIWSEKKRENIAYNFSYNNNFQTWLLNWWSFLFVANGSYMHIWYTHTHTVRSLICWHIDIKATNCRSKRDNKFLSNNNYNVSTKWISTNHIKVLIDRQPLRPFHFLTKNSSPFCFFDYYLLLLYIYITISNIFTNYISETILLFSPLLWICDCIRTSSLDKVQMCEIVFFITRMQIS